MASCKSCGSVGAENGLPHGVTTLAQVRHVARVEIAKRRANELVEPRFADEMAESVGRDGEAVGHSNALAGEFTHHLAERRVLAADQRDIGNGDVGKPFDQRGPGGRIRSEVGLGTGLTLLVHKLAPSGKNSLVSSVRISIMPTWPMPCITKHFIISGIGGLLV